jgi:hypothetical protein
MAASIYNLNLDPNIRWYIWLGPSDESGESSGAQGLIEFYESEDDLNNRVNRVAYGLFDYGEEVEIILTQDAMTPEISIHNDQEEFHCIATLLDGDDAETFQVGPYTDKDDVIDPLLVSPQAIQDRAQLEIDKGTHTAIRRTVTLATHIQGLEIGDIITLQDNMRGLDQTVRVDRIEIRGDKDSLTDVVEMVEFEELTR